MVAGKTKARAIQLTAIVAFVTIVAVRKWFGINPFGWGLLLVFPAAVIGYFYAYGASTARSSNNPAEGTQK